jgi:hypothetical protein
MTGPVLVDCARAELRLTEASCAKFWLGSNPDAPPVWQGRHRCHQCPAGAARAGVVIDPMQTVRDSLAPFCQRCRRLATRGDRNNGIINGRLCVSCYNREREVLRGSNAKGTPPRVVAARLFAARIVAVESGIIERIDRDISAGVLELVIHCGRRAKAPVMFGWAAPMLELAA